MPHLPSIVAFGKQTRYSRAFNAPLSNIVALMKTLGRPNMGLHFLDLKLIAGLFNFENFKLVDCMYSSAQLAQG